MRRTINSTGRQKIERGDITLTLNGPEDGPRTFDLDLDLSEYDLPPDARVFVEASRNAAWARFDYGTVASLTPPQDRTLADFGSAQRASFRIKIVDNVSNGDSPSARILAQADGVPTGDPEGDGPAQSLLAIDWNDEPMGDELWRVDIGDTVVLRVNRALFHGQHWTTLTESPAFRAIALPTILRQVLTDVIRLHGDDDPATGPLGLWVKYASSTLGAGALPEARADEQREPGEVESWINRAVESFCKKRRVRAAAVESSLIAEIVV